MKKKFLKRPWGEMEQFTLNEKTTVKILIVRPKQAPSVQYHHKRAEFWKILEGSCKIRKGNKHIKAKAGDEIFLPKKTVHSVEAYSKPVKILEISFGHFSEKDIVRLEDKYGRA